MCAQVELLYIFSNWFCLNTKFDAPPGPSLQVKICILNNFFVFLASLRQQDCTKLPGFCAMCNHYLMVWHCEIISTRDQSIFKNPNQYTCIHDFVVAVKSKKLIKRFKMNNHSDTVTFNDFICLFIILKWIFCPAHSITTYLFLAVWLFQWPNAMFRNVEELSTRFLQSRLQMYMRQNESVKCVLLCT